MLRLLLTPVLLLCLVNPGRAESDLVVEFVTVEQGPLVFDAALTGTVAATDTVDIGFRQGGRIDQVFVDEGDSVTAGQALARIDALQQEQALHVAEAAVAAAQATEAQTRQARNRASAMLDRGVGTRAELDATNQALSSAQRGLAQARTGQDQAARALEDTVIRAPTDAIVTTRRVEPGQIVGAAQAVISLASSTGREVVFQTPDTTLLRRAIGAPVSLQGIDFPDLRMTAHVTEIAPLVDPATGSVLARARIDDPPENFDLLGMAVRGSVHFPAGQGISVPWTALTAVGHEHAVWIVDNDRRARLTPVHIERFADGSVIVGSGLDAGQIVVGAGSQLLYPGRKVVDQHSDAGAQ
ncbi:efflux RND transporter periplasmic adaptor subunit [Paracoccus laeviglucosivorans]|uniref:RND family efflux transporter, MFP subunit n=1 Tax=Paracoccus laeviglucosivorans TaxID=1197861 RepID=A0A521DRL5_9RHOB|nr:efflux RND transporter periplasmic adaptor subunit [Paracoccus laeviglucosivorans]SMO74215.1 RND family efflux transporter, MFP subunit [Paracoccus laeviglucosivorans]